MTDSEQDYRPAGHSTTQMVPEAFLCPTCNAEPGVDCTRTNPGAHQRRVTRWAKSAQRVSDALAGRPDYRAIAQLSSVELAEAQRRAIIRSLKNRIIHHHRTKGLTS
ncbi:zinc finger domain-containing protein [Occultella kanbiaonis]|uniref:zinc finger domain-containing protein n=1 Tax=Occultella kanbiaonis TaxID=2675754 RepID=UPI0012B960B2|nr:hypothetical protein [Occultella kanbiaonis]